MPYRQSHSLSLFILFIRYFSGLLWTSWEVVAHELVRFI